MMLSPAYAVEPEVRAEDLPRTKPVEPVDAIKTFQVRKGFHIELAAAEPLVIDPIAMCFDENGRLFVVEMPRLLRTAARKSWSRIRMLEDTDGDGNRTNKATIFLDHLPWPTAICCYNGGILVGASPDIIYAKDTNGDGVADDVKTVFTGFGATQARLNVQGLFNNFIWGLDSRIHGCSGEDGGLVSSVLHPECPAHRRSRQRDSSARSAATGPSTTESGGGQYGLSYSAGGQLFTCTNSSHIEAFMFDARYAARNPFYTPPDPRVSIAADGPAAEVFRISPEEPWRVMRTRWRIAGLASGPIEGGGRSAGYFTGATGLTIYRGDAFGADYVGDAFVGDAGGNLAHHKRIRRGDDGISLIAERPADEKKSEFCASTDTWFRPVDFANAPDGCLYIADMYREVIEHPWSIPPSIKKYLDLNSGNDRGRIYRLAPDGYVERKPPKLGAATTADLVKLLEHPNGWHRETAARLLFERRDPAAAARLEKLAADSPSALARMHAIHLLDALGGLSEAAIEKRLDDPDAIVRAHAILLAERFIVNRTVSATMWSALTRLADDPDATVRYQLAFTLGQIDHPARAELLAKIIRRDVQSTWMRAAVLTSLAGGADRVVGQLAGDGAFTHSPAGVAFLGDAAKIVGAQG